MRRTHLRRRANILKRLLVHVGAYSLSLVLRRATGYGTPRGLRGKGSKGHQTASSMRLA